MIAAVVALTPTFALALVVARTPHPHGDAPCEQVRRPSADLLAAFGANKEAVETKDGKTALLLAADHGHAECVAVLVEARHAPLPP